MFVFFPPLYKIKLLRSQIEYLLNCFGYFRSRYSLVISNVIRFANFYFIKCNYRQLIKLVIYIQNFEQKLGYFFFKNRTLDSDFRQISIKPAKFTLQAVPRVTKDMYFDHAITNKKFNPYSIITCVPFLNG